MTDDDAHQVWLRSHPDPDGVYRVQLELGPDDVVPLDDHTGVLWARHVVQALVDAEYDAAVVAQMRATGLDLDSAAGLLTGMREARRAVRRAADLESPIPDLHLTPGVSAFTRRPFLGIHRNGVQVGQWDADDARSHAAGVLEILEAAVLDEIYRRTLIDVAGLEASIAESVVDDLARHRVAP